MNPGWLLGVLLVLTIGTLFVLQLSLLLGEVFPEHNPTLTEYGDSVGDPTKFDGLDPSEAYADVDDDMVVDVEEER